LLTLLSNYHVYNLLHKSILLIVYQSQEIFTSVLKPWISAKPNTFSQKYIVNKFRQFLNNLIQNKSIFTPPNKKLKLVN